jgi:hypothetical protein
MFCTKCGTENPDNAMFCKSCGASLLVQERPQENTYTPPVSTPADVVTIVRRHASSAKFLVATVLLAVAVGLGLVMNLLSGGKPIDMMIAVIGVIGAFLIYNEGKAQGDYFKSAGFTMLKTTAVINLVGTFIIAAMVILAAVVIYSTPDVMTEAVNDAMAQLEEAGLGERLKNAFAEQGLEYNAEAFASLIMSIIPLALFVLAIVIGVTLMLLFPAIKAIGKIKKAGITNVMEGTVSKLLIVLLYINGGMMALGLLGGSLADGLQGVAYIIYAMVLQDFNRDLQEIA